MGVPANEKFVGIPVRKVSEKGTWIEFQRICTCGYRKVKIRLMKRASIDGISVDALFSRKEGVCIR